MYYTMTYNNDDNNTDNNNNNNIPSHDIVSYITGAADTARSASSATAAALYND